ncbi:MAG TPA: L-threonylcarbamoyladenylate synthase [Actinomycetes bacterium]|nr:L-threonylcarbamoyladenylate synthase [Actinomycetes bacterium]
MTLRTTRDASEAVEVLRRGGLVALPTETVYGLAGDATSASAIARIFAAKGRPTNHPVIVHLPDQSHVDRWAVDTPQWATDLMSQVWPGPLTVIVPRAPSVLDAVTGGQSTVGLRVPAHPLTLEVLGQLDTGVAAPSANRYGRVSPTTAVHVVAELSAHLDPERDLVLDGGPCPVGVESTIIGAWDDVPRLLRPGAVTTQRVASITGRQPVTTSSGVRAPGTTATHYSPSANVVAIERDDLEATLEDLPGDKKVGVIALADVDTSAQPVTRLSSPGDQEEYAQTLYAALHQADISGMEIVIAVLPPPGGLGAAIRDRLRRAAAAERAVQ